MKVKQVLFTLLFFSIQVFFIFLYLNKQERLIGLSYEIQKNEKKIDLLNKNKNKLLLSLQEIQDQTNIKTVAQKNGMLSMKLTDIGKLSHA